MHINLVNALFLMHIKSGPSLKTAWVDDFYDFLNWKCSPKKIAGFKIFDFWGRDGHHSTNILTGFDSENDHFLKDNWVRKLWKAQNFPPAAGVLFSKIVFF
jgi:hypothetical protein